MDEVETLLRGLLSPVDGGKRKGYTEELPDYKDVRWFKLSDGRRIDFFYLS